MLRRPATGGAKQRGSDGVRYSRELRSPQPTRPGSRDIRRRWYRATAGRLARDRPPQGRWLVATSGGPRRGRTGVREVEEYLEESGSGSEALTPLVARRSPELQVRGRQRPRRRDGRVPTRPLPSFSSWPRRRPWLWPGPPTSSWSRRPRCRRRRPRGSRRHSSSWSSSGPPPRLRRRQP